MSKCEAVVDVHTLEKIISRFPRVSLGFFPTPLHDCPRLTKLLKGPRILMKREDCTGLALGGNKTRHLEFSMGEALAQKADILLAGAGIHSNYCRQAAAAAARLGLQCHFILARVGQINPAIQGNYLLLHLLGAHIELADVPMGEPVQVLLRKAEEELRSQGHRPYGLLTRPRCEMLGALSYVLAFLELQRQLKNIQVEADYIYLAAGGPTPAGLLWASKALGTQLRIHSVAGIKWGYDIKVDIATTANRLSEWLGLPLVISREEVLAWEEYVGDGYGYATPDGLAAIRTVAQTEGILLDPVYTGKAMAGLIDHIRQGIIAPDKTVVFLHTGGTPAIFNFAGELLGAQIPS